MGVAVCLRARYCAFFDARGKRASVMNWLAPNDVKQRRISVEFMPSLCLIPFGCLRLVTRVRHRSIRLQPCIRSPFNKCVRSPLQEDR
jgi:hypothetical protein